MTYLLLQASASHIPLADESVQTVVTSPPYWGLRQYAGEQREVWGGLSDCAHFWTTTTTTTATTNGTGSSTLSGGHESWGERGGSTAIGSCMCGAWYGALGLEPTPDLYVEHMVAIFREVKRVLRRDGTLWLNLGDSYTSMGRGGRKESPGVGATQALDSVAREIVWAPRDEGDPNAHFKWSLPGGYKPKDLVGIPWMVAFALRADGWYLRSDIIWAKPNPMPESVTDRPTKAHEYLFLLSKSERYYYDADAIREPAIYAGVTVKASDPLTAKNAQKGDYGATALGFTQHDTTVAEGRNKRTVWNIATKPYPGAHFATYPEELVEPCILAGSKPGDLVCDPFNGSGTTGRVAIVNGRSYVGLDVSREYLVEQAIARIDSLAGAQLEARDWDGSEPVQATLPL